MSNLSMFMKKNKVVKQNIFYPATQSLRGEDGSPLQWEIKQLTTKEDEIIREECTKEVPVIGKPNMYRPKLDTNAYIGKMIAASVVTPNLYSAELQDSYGVKTPEDLLKEMIDNPGEYQDLTMFIQKFNGFNVSLDEKVAEAKN